MGGDELSVISVNVGRVRVIGQLHGEDVLSAIGKAPVSRQRTPSACSGSTATSRPIFPCMAGRTKRSMPIPPNIGRGGKTNMGSFATRALRRESDAARRRRKRGCHRRPFPLGRCAARNQPAAFALFQACDVCAAGYPGAHDAIGAVGLVSPRCRRRRGGGEKIHDARVDKPWPQRARNFPCPASQRRDARNLAPNSRGAGAGAVVAPILCRKNRRPCALNQAVAILALSLKIS